MLLEKLDFETEHPQFESLINEILLQNGFKTNFQPSFNGSEDVTYMLKKVEESGGKSIHFLVVQNYQHHTIMKHSTSMKILCS